MVEHLIRKLHIKFHIFIMLLHLVMKSTRNYTFNPFLKKNKTFSAPKSFLILISFTHHHWRAGPGSTLTLLGLDRVADDGYVVAEQPNLIPPRSTYLPLDTKYLRKNTKLYSFVGHTPWENPKIHIFISGSQMRE